jgi:hypothetical protein
MGNKGKPGQTSKKKGEEDDDLNDFSKVIFFLMCLITYVYTFLDIQTCTGHAQN